ncbi:MAG: 1,4-dihydroxy-2-naphthoate polyprenyltransferase [Pseudonocardiales bacterium]|nr:1,4-dihydroxy-2-naphthoate polyprenyltransferase [Pseudonocardiales bacterium]PZS26867.1 MAG: 1,4-dihydroxy-2-naphthoate polyprenyltransferase [Pseudonocardiales bacterium]
MASVEQWVEGARPRTLPNSIAPVLAGWGAAAALGASHWVRALLALVVALALQIGVNYANDYSDGIRGTDAVRVGPMRLVGSGVAAPSAVRTAALGSFAVAGVAGLTLIALAGQWWLLAVGAACLAAAWYYTGGTRPYGYAGLGELAVFVFFGLVAVLGTQYVVSGRITPTGGFAAVAVGAMSAAVLVANNLRDIPTDAATAKRTLAVRLGDRRTRMLYTALVAVPFAVTLGLAISRWTALAALLALVFAVPALRRVRGGANGPELIRVLRDTGLALLVWAAATAAALAFSATSDIEAHPPLPALVTVELLT